MVTRCLPTTTAFPSTLAAGGSFVVVGCGDANAPRLAADPGKNGNSLVHVIAGDKSELADVNKAIAAGGVKGCVTAEQLALAKLPYRDYMVNVMVVMDLAKATKAGFNAIVPRWLAPVQIAKQIPRARAGGSPIGSSTKCLLICGIVVESPERPKTSWAGVYRRRRIARFRLKGLHVVCSENPSCFFHTGSSGPGDNLRRFDSGPGG